MPPSWLSHIVERSMLKNVRHRKGGVPSVDPMDSYDGSSELHRDETVYLSCACREAK